MWVMRITRILRIVLICDYVNFANLWVSQRGYAVGMEAHLRARCWMSLAMGKRKAVETRCGGDRDLRAKLVRTARRRAAPDRPNIFTRPTANIGNLHSVVYNLFLS